MSALALTVPQGIGDIVWVWQKAAGLPGVDSIAFRVIETEGAPTITSRRADAVIRQLPMVADVDYLAVDRYPRWTAALTQMAEVLPDAAAGRHPGWAANPWLENGFNLEVIDPTLPVRWDLGVEPRPVDGLTAGRYLALYVSGDTARHATLYEAIWPVEKWATLADRVCYNAGVGTTLPVVLVGAAYDYPILQAVGDLLRKKNFKTALAVELPLPELLWLLGRSWGFVGYQSGLSVLAAAVGAHQHIVYFPRLVRLGATWVRPEHRADGRFTYSTFAMPPQEVAGRVRFPAPA
jgi:hypothetical protein